MQGNSASAFGLIWMPAISNCLQTRLAYLLMMTPAPPCLGAHRSKRDRALSTVSAERHATAKGSRFSRLPPRPRKRRSPSATIDNGPVYDLDALLLEAQADIVSQEYQRAVDTLDAIIALDERFQRDRVRELLFAALTSQATGALPQRKIVRGDYDDGTR